MNNLIKFAFIFCFKNFVQSQHNPYFYPQRSVIVQLFEWKFADISRECEEFLGPKGYGGVQISPVSENIIVPNRPWLERYQPISYKIHSRSGTEEEFKEMIERCNKANVRVYIDVVFNNMAAPQEKMRGTAGSLANNREFPEVPYRSDEFHQKCRIENYYEAHEVRNCEIMDMPDLDHSLESVRMKLAEFLNRLIDFGVAGFRVGGAKHMWPNDLKAIFDRISPLNRKFDFEPKSRPFTYLEVIDLNKEPISKTEYNFLGPVTELLYSEKIGEIFRRKFPLSTLFKWGLDMGFLPPEDAVVFVDNHDIQRGYGGGSKMVLSHKIPREYKMAIAFMLAHPYGIPIVTSSYKYETIDEGPPSDDQEQILSPIINEMGACDDRWICEHRWPDIVNMISFRNSIEGTKIESWQNIRSNNIAFCRGDKGFIAFNNDPEEDLEEQLHVCLPPGEYCDITDDWSDNEECRNKMVVNEERKALVKIPSKNGYAAYYIGSRLS